MFQACNGQGYIFPFQCPPFLFMPVMSHDNKTPSLSIFMPIEYAEVLERIHENATQARLL